MGFYCLRRFMPAGSRSTNTGVVPARVGVSGVVTAVGLAGVGVGMQHMVVQGTRRFYHANSHLINLNSAKKMQYVGRWLRFCERNWVELVMGAAALATISYFRIERVPYTNKFHLVCNHKAEEKMAEQNWKEFMVKNKGNILPLSDPRSIRAQSVATNLIRALKRGLRLNRECNVNGSSCENINGDYWACREWEKGHHEEKKLLFKEWDKKTKTKTPPMETYY